MFSHLVTQSVQVSLATINSQKTYSGASRLSIEETIAIGTTTVGAAIDVSALKSFFLLSDQDVTVKTNSNSEPDATLVLKAGVAYVWNTDSYDAFKLVAADIVSIYVTNASAAPAKLQLEAIIDPTP